MRPDVYRVLGIETGRHNYMELVVGNCAFMDSRRNSYRGTPGDSALLLDIQGIGDKTMKLNNWDMLYILCVGFVYMLVHVLMKH